MFSKALFKQSCKANGVMWTIISFAVCLMLACVMLISGNGTVGNIKNAIEDTIITKEIDSSLKKRALKYYELDNDGLMYFDNSFVENTNEVLPYHTSFVVWQSQKPDIDNFTSLEAYEEAIKEWKNNMPSPSQTCEQLYALNYSNWVKLEPNREDFDTDDNYLLALEKWNQSNPCSINGVATVSYSLAINDLQNYIKDKAIKSGYEEDSNEHQEMLASIMYCLNPNHVADNFYISNNETIPSDYDISSLLVHVQSNDIQSYLISDSRLDYISNRSENAASIFLAGNMILEENVEKIVEQLASFGVDKEKYDSFNYTYDNIKHIAKTTIVTYISRFEYETNLLKEKYKDSDVIDGLTYQEAYIKMHEELSKDVTNSLLSSLPQEVSDALKEVGQMDLFGLIVGSIYFKLAGILLPIIYMIVVSNNLISSQVDTGSMAYVLSTSIKRKTVAFTQGVFLVGSLFAMFVLTTLTGGICLAIVHNNVALTFGKLVLLNVGAFLVLFCLSGLCFLTSCWFDRSKRSMSIGGGLSIFALVAAMLGLFGSPVIPSVVRMNALNCFNYVTIISLFDVVSILNGTTTFIYKLFILFVLGLVGYFVGTKKFIKKDLPL